MNIQDAGPVTDTRIVNGARCTWWDSIDKIGVALIKIDASTLAGTALPVCPHCKGPLFETESEEKWWEAVNRYVEAGHPNYPNGDPTYDVLLKWIRGKCFPTMDVARASWIVSQNLPPQRLIVR